MGLRVGIDAVEKIKIYTYRKSNPGNSACRDTG
jgi:hypothetical protein